MKNIRWFKASFKSLHQYLFLLVFAFVAVNICNATAETYEFDTKSKEFRLVTAIYPPYNYVEEQNVKGLNIDIVKAAFSAVNYHVTIDVLPFGRALWYAKQGDYDGITLWYSKPREQWFHFSNPFTQSELIFFKKSSLKIKYRNIADIQPFSIGTVQKYAYPKFITDNTELKLSPVITDEQNIKKLVLGRIELALIDHRMAVFIMNQHYPSLQKNFNSAGVLKSENYYLAIAKKTPNFREKLADFNQGLLIIKQNGTLKKIISQYDSL